MSGVRINLQSKFLQDDIMKNFILKVVLTNFLKQEAKKFNRGRIRTSLGAETDALHQLSYASQNNRALLERERSCY